MDLTAFFKYLQHEKRYSQHTVVSYMNDLDQFRLYLEEEMEMSLEEVNHHQIRGWVVSLMDSGLSSRSVNRKISTLRTFYKYLLKTGQVELNPVSKVTVPRMSKKLPVFVDKTSMSNLLDEFEFPDGFEGQRDKLILDVFYQTGIRLSELINLKDSDVSVDKIKVLGKRNKERFIPIGIKMSDSIQDYLLNKRIYIPDCESFVFVTNKGKKLYQKFVYRLVNRYLSKASSLSKRSPHILRHTFATHMLNNGADLNAIKEILGHANLSATQVYTHNSIDKLKEVHKLAHPRGGV